MISGNFAFSNNKIRSFTEYIDSSNADYSVYTQVKNSYANTDISFSPDKVSSLLLTFLPNKDLSITLVNKNVSRQYLDNTQQLSRSLAPYSTFDLNLNYRVSKLKWPQLELMASVYNLLNTQYSSNGYTYSYYLDSADLSTFNFLAPAAPLNFLAGLRLHF